MRASMRHRACTVLLTACVALLAGAAWAGYPMRVKDARGREILIKAKPMRIVSLTPGNTEILYALGLGDRVVGVTRYCDYPAAAKSKPKIGDMVVSTEAVIARKPDLVFAHAHMNSTAIPALEKLGLRVFAIDPKTLGEVARDIRTVGKITAKPKAADMAAAKIEGAIRAVRAAAAKRPSRKALLVVSSNPLWIAGPRTFVDEMLAVANAKNTAFDARPGFVTFSRELAISRNPDVVITGQKSDTDFFAKSPEWRTTNAVKSKRVYVIDSDLLFRAGPRLADGLKELAGKVSY